MPEVIALGELLIDFVPTVSGLTLMETPAFQKAPGGAPANVAVGISKLGIPSGFMGKVGDDAFGRFLAKTLEDAGVDISALCFSEEARTALAFVSLTSEGERDFLFYRHPSADMLYRPDEVDEDYIRAARIFHYGSISLIGEPSRGATLRAVSVAHQAGLLISYDPNLRLALWPDADTARREMLAGWQHAQIIKISEEELVFLTGESDWVTAARSLWHVDQRLLVVTRGKDGSSYITETGSGEVPGFSVQVVDTTGAGDGFVAGLLKGLYESPRAWEDEARLREILRYANAVGAITTTKRGAIPALPTSDQVEQFMNAQITAER